ncbi:MAG: hypothetical protein H0V43_05715 [Gemmatimonadales bacterium]|nr:hypothetical protein [Gemmatimonadales bacterium]
MEVFELVIALLLVGAALAASARRLNLPYPAFLALAAPRSPWFRARLSTRRPPRSAGGCSRSGTRA